MNFVLRKIACMNNPNQTVDQPSRAEAPSTDAAPARNPERVGRYRIERVLGQGGFRVVYLAYDEQLSRRVAIKTPHPQMMEQASDAEACLTEARTVAGLDHPHIVPHDLTQ